MTKRMTIDKLLEWVINDELRKGEHVMRDVRRIIEDIGEPDGPNPKRRYISPSLLTGCYLGGEPHRDAWIIARHLQSFSVYFGLSNEGQARALLGPLADLEPRSIQAALAKRPNLAALMITCAVLKRPPHLNLDHPKPRPVCHGGDHRRLTVLRLDLPDGGLVPAYVRHWEAKRPDAWYGEPRCPISWEDPTIRLIAEQRAEYTIWWRMMGVLQGRLAGRLSEYEAAPLECSPSPWLAPPPAAPRVLKAIDGISATPTTPQQLVHGGVANAALPHDQLVGVTSLKHSAPGNGCEQELAA
jgi:hypothetical protein